MNVAQTSSQGMNGTGLKISLFGKKLRDAPVFMRLSGLPEMLFAVIWLFEVFR
jgi:hypothetical protein